MALCRGSRARVRPVYLARVVAANEEARQYEDQRARELAGPKPQHGLTLEPPGQLDT